jgi:asparagine synthase (glutamine-hydrolysing)
MCGIVGFTDKRGMDASRAAVLGHKMTEAVIHRGPDSQGVWIDDKNGVVLGHRRLSIVELTSAGHQPMSSATGRYVIIFNGEIYNHLLLRKELEAQGLAQQWWGCSDTETILALIEAFGLQTALGKMVGMFALALWDKEERELYLARDRVGEKPLYYGTQGAVSFFASEIKSLRQHPDFHPEINLDALCLYLRHNYIPQPHSIYKDIFKLPAGHFIKLANGEKPKPYWSLDEIVFNSSSSFSGSDIELLNNLDEVLKQAVSLQMQADVPIGAFLSGGVDSSLIVALMQEQSTRPVKSFSIGFDNDEFDEAPYAKAVANYLGTDHHELYVTSEQALNVIPKLPSLYDEPFSDSSQIPTYLVSEIAKQHVSVSLSGDAGDELFGGYNRYHWGVNIHRNLSILPIRLRRLMSGSITAISPEMWNTLLAPINKLLPQKYNQKNVGDRLHKLSQVIGVQSEDALYQLLISHWQDPEKIVLGGIEPETIITKNDARVQTLPFAMRMMYFDMLSYLPDDILVKVDRAAMGVSLETRVPFLDHRVIEAAWQLPMKLKIRQGKGKYCLRELLSRRVPKSLIDRPKMGFGVPLSEWLRGPLRDWAETLLDEKRLKQSGYFDASKIRTVWSEHTSRQRNWQYYLWDILMFEAWRDEAGL